MAKSFEMVNEQVQEFKGSLFDNRFFCTYKLAVVSCCSKKLINRVQCRLKLLKNKRNSIVRQLREDMAQLIKSGHEHIAFNRVCS